MLETPTALLEVQEAMTTIQSAVESSTESAVILNEIKGVHTDAYRVGLNISDSRGLPAEFVVFPVRDDLND